MADPSKMPREELERAKDLGAAAYCAAYIHLMARELGIDETDTEGIRTMIVQMVEPMNHATEAIWRALMNDNVGKEEVLIRFRQSLMDIDGHI